jgi:hypothetical protein
MRRGAQTQVVFGLAPDDVAPLALALGGVLLYVSSWSPSGPVLGIAILMAALVAIGRQAGAVVLMLGGLWLIDGLLRATGWTPNQALTAAELVWAGALLAWAVFALQLVEKGPQHPGRMTGPPGTRSEPDTQPGQGPQWPQQVAAGGAKILLATSMAAAILWLVPLDPSRPNRWGVAPAAWRYLQLLWGLIAAGLVLSTLLSIKGWRGLHPREARTYLYQLMGEQTDRERRLIVRRRDRGKA